MRGLRRMHYACFHLRYKMIVTSCNRLGSTLYFELRGTLSTGSSVIQLPDLHLREEDDLSLMKFCILQYKVPFQLRFPLLSRIRYARAFRSSRMCRIYSKISLLAFIVLVQSSDAHDELASFFDNDPEYANELIRIVKSEEIVSGTMKTLAVTALGAQVAAYSACHKRARILSALDIIVADGFLMIVLNVLQRALLSLNNPIDLSSIVFVEALLQFFLLHVISSASTGTVVRGSGMVTTFLPLLEDSNPTHLRLVCIAVKILQKLMDYSNTAVTLFSDLAGIELLIRRLQVEAHRLIDFTGSKDNTVTTDDYFEYTQSYTQKRLVRALLKALGSATYATANSVHSQNSYDAALAPTLLMIFSNKVKFGGEIFSAAVTLMSEMIHKDPTCFNALYDLGLPAAFLSSVVAGILPSSKAITCIPNGLGAVCLNSKGLEAVRETSALRFLVEIFTDRKYVMVVNEAIVPLSNALEELLRHVSSLRGSGVDLIIEIINSATLLADAKLKGSIRKTDEMDMDSVESGGMENLSGCSEIGIADCPVDGISDQQCMQLCIFHVIVLLHKTMENSETCRLFVEKSGIEAVLKLLLRPSITQSSEGMSIALNCTVVFKCFTQQHSSRLARAICSSLRDLLKETLARFSNLSGSFLLDPKASPDPLLFSSLSLIEFALFLAASKDSRWLTALFTEFGNGEKDVLVDIGHVHREVLWQIALLEDVKVAAEDESTDRVHASQQSEWGLNDTEDPRLNFTQFLDPVLRRRTSGWSFESQFSELINWYRDFSRPSSRQHQQVVDPLLNLPVEPGLEQHGSSSLDLTESSARKDDDNQRSRRRSFRDMVSSLSIHITHMFQELGKVMLLPSRRREDVLNLSPSAKSVGRTMGLLTV